MLRKMLIVSTGIILLVGCSPKIDQQKYENLHQAAKTIEGATVVGVKYLQFGELLKNLSTEFSIANDKAKSDNEKKLLKAYLDVLMTYRESVPIWKYKIEAARYDWIPPGQIYVESELKPIIAKYSLPMESHIIPITGHEFQTISGDALQVIWVKAQERLENATKLYLGQ